MRRGWHFSRVEVSAALKDGDGLVTLQFLDSCPPPSREPCRRRRAMTD